MAATTDPSPIFIHSMSVYCGLQVPAGGGAAGALSSNAFIANGQALLFPLELPFSYQIARFFWVNGGAVGGNTDVGIYSSALSLLTHTGSIANAGTSSPQYTSVSFTLGAGSYYLALCCSTTTQGYMTLNTVGSGLIYQLGGQTSQAVSPPLPATAVPVATNFNHRPFFGFTRTASGY